MLGDDRALSVQDVVDRDGGIGHVGGGSAREVDGQIDRVLAEEFVKLRFGIPGGQQEGDVLVFERVGQTLDAGHLIHARAAPCCPDIEKYHLPLEVTERQGLSGKALQLPAVVRRAADSGQPRLRQARIRL